MQMFHVKSQMRCTWTPICAVSSQVLDFFFISPVYTWNEFAESGQLTKTLLIRSYIKCSMKRADCCGIVCIKTVNG